MLPLPVKFSEYIQEYINLSNQTTDPELEEQRLVYDFIVGELLLIAEFLDYGDAYGRSAMRKLLRKYSIAIIIFLYERIL